MTIPVGNIIRIIIIIIIAFLMRIYLRATYYSFLCTYMLKNVPNVLNKRNHTFPFTFDRSTLKRQ